MTRLRAQLTYANVMATVAVFLALGGGAYAAIQLPRNSVTAKQIAKNAVRSSEVKNRSLLRRDFRAGSLPAGERGPQGEPGQPGQPGQPGPGAVKLHLDRAPVDEVVTLGTVGAWTIRARCAPTGGVSVPYSLQVFVDGPGTADLAATAELNGGTPSSEVRRQDLSADNQVYSIGIFSGDVSHRVGTMVLSAGPAAPVTHVAFALVLDSAVPGGHCTFVGTATPAS